MSLKTWEAEYYPFPAKDCTPKTAIRHSLLKWYGLRKVNLERHGCTHDAYLSDEITDSVSFFPISSGSCALCKVYYNCKNKEHPCEACPLAKSRDGVPCDLDTPEGTPAPYTVWVQDKDPEPMIAALEKALKEQE